MSGAAQIRLIRRLARCCLLILLVGAAGCGVRNRNDQASSAAQGDVIERTAAKGPVKLAVRVWPKAPRLSDLLQMEVRVESQPGVEIKPPAFGQAVGDFLIRDYSERPPEAGTTGTRLFRYELEPAHAGKHLIRSVAIEFVDKRPGSERSGEPALVETEPLEVNVTSELGSEAPSLAKLQPMLPPQAVPQTTALGWMAAAGVVLALAVLGFVLLRRRRRRPVEPRRQTPEEIAHAALARLLAEDLPARGLVKEFYLRLTGIVRQYVEDTTGIRAPEQTTEEFLRDIRARAVFPPDRSVRLADFLESADLVKYAGQMPEPGQIDQAIARAQEFVNLAPAAMPVPEAVAVGEQA
jgi:LPXTG-motif cell wall-anchored protein